MVRFFSSARVALRGPLPARVTKRLEDSQVGRVVQHLPFRVPLHAEGEGRAVLDRDRLDQAIWRHRFGAQAGGEAVDALTVDRVDLDLAGQAHGLEHAAGLDRHRVCRGVLDVEARVVGYYRTMDGYFYNTKLDRNEPNVDEKYFRGKLEFDKGGPFAAELKLEYADFEMKGQPRDVFGAVGGGR